MESLFKEKVNLKTFDILKNSWFMSNWYLIELVRKGAESQRKNYSVNSILKCCCSWGNTA